MLKTHCNLLFHFENEYMEIIEIKRYDIASDDKSKVYYWLLYNKTDNLLTHLVFASMRSDDDFEFREFQDSTLVFNNVSAVFECENERYNLLNTDKELKLSEHLKNAIDNFLLSN